MVTKIYKSRIWKQPKVALTILRNVPILDPSVILCNSKLFYIKENKEIISFITFKEQFGFLQLGTVFTYPKFRKKNHMKNLLNQVLNDQYNISVLCRKELCTFYSKFGFKEKKDCGWVVSLRKKTFNTFLKPFFGYEIISMKKQ